MQPNGQMPPPPQQNPYDYILNPATPPKKSFAFGGGGKPKPLVLTAFVLGVLLLVVIAFSVFSSLTSTNYNSVIDLAQRQNEIVRISDLGLAQAQDPATLIYVSTVRDVTLSEQQSTLAFLAKKNQNVGTKLLALKKDTSTDQALTTAEQNNQYDQVLLDKLNGLLSSYYKAEKNVSGVSGSISETALFNTLFSNAKIIGVSN